jgi:hypothetical protein
MKTTKKMRKVMSTAKIFMMSQRLLEMRFRYFSRCVCALSAQQGPGPHRAHTGIQSHSPTPPASRAGDVTEHHTQAISQTHGHAVRR